MSDYKYVMFVIFFASGIYFGSWGQNISGKEILSKGVIDRQPAVSGQFYPAGKNELQQELKALFIKAEPKKEGVVAAVISPHAGYIYSGVVAASSFNQVDFSRNFDNIFILASSHRAYYEGASIYSLGDYITPLGRVEVNRKIAGSLVNNFTEFSYVPQAHMAEHSIEVQLPFLQHKIKGNFQIVPIVIGTQSPKVCASIAKALFPFFNERNLFIISSDFSHYPGYNNANYLDSLTAEALVSNSTDTFLNVINDEKYKAVDNLSTRACGWTALLTLLYMTEDDVSYSYKKIIYKNSGDTGFGDKNRVVGYHSIAVYHPEENNSGFYLLENEKKELLQIARNTIYSLLTNGESVELNARDYSENLNANCGAFVTLNKDHNLRGCIGLFSADEPLFKVVQQMAIASATRDSRFQPVSLNELDEINIEISVLTPMKKVVDIKEIKLGQHGIYIKKGTRSGTFLPQVATETGWTLEEFLGHCARDKAGIGWTGWKNAEVYIYEALVFSE